MHFSALSPIKICQRKFRRAETRVNHSPKNSQLKLRHVGAKQIYEENVPGAENSTEEYRCLLP